MGEAPRPRHRGPPGGRGLTDPARDLRELALLHGVQLSHVDGLKRRRRAPRETLLAVLRALGAPVDRMEDVPAAVRERRLALLRRPLDPVVVAWDGAPRAVEVRVARDLVEHAPPVALEVEDGEERRLTAVPTGAETRSPPSATLRVDLPNLPPGYHRLRLEAEGAESLVVSAPSRAFRPRERAWGVFAPIHAIHSDRSGGPGDLTDLKDLAGWVAGLGGGLVGTLPPLASFLDEPYEPSPYAPVSRLFWNEVYVDPGRAPGLDRSPDGRALLERLGGGGGGEAGPDRLADFRRAAAAKRRVLETVARDCLADGGPERFRRFAGEHPRLDEYALFRAAAERHRAGWPEWPPPHRDGAIPEGDVDPGAVRYHRYAQWAADEQLRSVSEGGRARLYLDLPLGVHPGGYDTWSDRALFATGVSAGAPADEFSLEGQDWGFSPLDPERSRRDGHRYTIDSIRHLLRHAGALRIDHVMALHRLFWVPAGMPATAGTYVRYPAEELYAILCLESHRARARVVGEDLGTVPRRVRRAMADHDIHRIYVLQAEAGIAAARGARIAPAPPNAQAGLNTHDMPTFGGFWHGVDIDRRVRLGLLDEGGAARERRARSEARAVLLRHLREGGWLEEEGEVDAEAALRASLRCLAAGPARVTIAALEDLWMEEEQQNVPGTTDEHPNWRRLARHRLEDARRLPAVLDMLREVDRLRRGRERG